jgi:tetratricopeptide (TPR) repeat protein
LRVYLESNEALIEVNWATALSNVRRYREAAAHFGAAQRLIHSPGIDIANAEIIRKSALIAAYEANSRIEIGDLEHARLLLASAASIVNKTLRTDPANITAQQDDLAVTAIQGRLDVADGHPAAGLARLDRAIGGDERILAHDREYAQARSYLSRHYLWAGDAWMAAKRPDRARTRYAQAVDLAGATVKSHPDDANSRAILAAGEAGLSTCR